MNHDNDNGTDDDDVYEEILSIGKSVSRKSNVVLRPSGAWTKGIHQVLTHLHHRGFTLAPQLAGDGFAPDGREALTYMHGDVIHPAPWSDEGIAAVGAMIRSLHDSMGNFHADRTGTVWQDWFLHGVGRPSLISHCDIAPWNVLTKDGTPCALIDWEFVGPVDPFMELARACWLFPQLVDDRLAAQLGLPTPAKRAEQVRLLVDSYGLSASEREGMLDRIIEIVVHETANEATEANVTRETVGPLWGFAWRARSASWIVHQRDILRKALS